MKPGVDLKALFLLVFSPKALTLNRCWVYCVAPVSCRIALVVSMDHRCVLALLSAVC